MVGGMSAAFGAAAALLETARTSEDDAKAKVALDDASRLIDTASTRAREIANYWQMPSVSWRSRWTAFAVAKKAGVPMERVFVNVQRYGNMSAATVPVALCEALEEGRVKPGSLLLMPSFGGGLTFTGHVVRWGERVTPLGTTGVELPPNKQSALEIVERYRAINKLRVVEA